MHSRWRPKYASSVTYENLDENLADVTTHHSQKFHEEAAYCCSNERLVTKLRTGVEQRLPVGLSLQPVGDSMFLAGHARTMG